MITNDSRVSVNDALKDSYDSYYSEGENEWRELGAKHKVNNIIEMCSSIPHATIIDIGAGEGAVSAEISKREFCSNINCLEISKSGVEVIRKRNLPNVKEAHEFDGYQIQYPDTQFDLAVVSHVLEHVEHERLFLYEVKRVAKYIFIEVPLEDTLRLPANYVPSRVGHINFYNYMTIRHLLQSSGLEVIDQRLYDTPLDVHMFTGKVKGIAKFAIRRCVNSVSVRLSARIFTYHCGLLCRSA